MLVLGLLGPKFTLRCAITLPLGYSFRNWEAKSCSKIGKMWLKSAQIRPSSAEVAFDAQFGPFLVEVALHSVDLHQPRPKLGPNLGNHGPTLADIGLIRVNNWSKLV